MIDTIVILLSTLVGVVSLLFLLKFISSRVQKKLAKIIENKFSQKEIVLFTTSANFFGLKSEGVTNTRGNGALILTNDTLHYIRAVPEKEYIIPLNKIIEITQPTSFNGRSIFAPLLCVEFEYKNGKDAIGWAVKNPDNWKKKIEQTKQLNK